MRKRVAGVATLPGRERALAEMIASIVGQVDELHVWANKGYGDWPGDAGKFAFVRPGVLYFALDDDLIYPPDYCDTMAAAVMRKRLATTHGRDYEGITKVDGYYHGAVTRRYRGLDLVEEGGRVDVPGSGSSVFYGEDVHLGTTPILYQFPEPNMADLWLGLIAKRNGIYCACVPHAAGWLQHSPHADLDSMIWARENENDTRQTELLNRILCE